jgi:uncharacterized membrane protein YoaK (UPF0700 family)
MFRHKGNSRTFKHNFRLAVFLSFIAGLVNICGVSALGVLTTNVTGHFAYFAEGVIKENNAAGVYFLYYIVSFLLGSFISSLLMEYFINIGYNAPHKASMLVELFLLLTLGIYGDIFIDEGFSRPLLACIMLFTMGLQNSLVSKVSNSAVRTTHLTGLFTDLGIELSQLFFHVEKEQRTRLLRNLGLRSGIIIFFFSGCIVGGFLYTSIKFKILIIAAFVLIIALVYDNLRLGYYRIWERFNSKM